MKRLLLFGAILAMVLAATATAAPKTPSGTISGPNEAGPYAFGDFVTFTTGDFQNLKGNEYPMVYVLCVSAVDGEGLWGQLDHPDTVFKLGGGSSRWHLVHDDANCSATLYAYGGRAGHGTDSITQMAPSVLFDAAG